MFSSCASKYQVVIGRQEIPVGRFGYPPSILPPIVEPIYESLRVGIEKDHGSLLRLGLPDGRM